MESVLTPMRKRLIETSAGNLLIEAQITQPSVPVGTLLEQFAAIHSYNCEGGTGFCCCAPEEYLVFINANRKVENETYFLACALAHYRLEHFEIPQPRSAEQEKKVTAEAEYFADCLLMPENWLRWACEDRTVTQPEARELARRFDVPLEALYRRLCYLGIPFIPTEPIVISFG